MLGEEQQDGRRWARIYSQRAFPYLGCALASSLRGSLGVTYPRGGAVGCGEQGRDRQPVPSPRMEHYLSLPADKAVEHMPVLFIAFPSAKDPSWEDRFSGGA